MRLFISKTQNDSARNDECSINAIVLFESHPREKIKMIVFKVPDCGQLTRAFADDSTAFNLVTPRWADSVKTLLRFPCLFPSGERS